MERCPFCSGDIEGFTDIGDVNTICSNCGGYLPEFQTALTQAIRTAIVFVLVAISLIAFSILSIVLTWNSY